MNAWNFPDITILCSSTIFVVPVTPQLNEEEICSTPHADTCFKNTHIRPYPVNCHNKIECFYAHFLWISPKILIMILLLFLCLDTVSSLYTPDVSVSTRRSRKKHQKIGVALQRSASVWTESRLKLALECLCWAPGSGRLACAPS